MWPGISGEAVYRLPDTLRVVWPHTLREGLLCGPLDAREKYMERLIEEMEAEKREFDL